MILRRLWWALFPARWEFDENGQDMRRRLSNGRYEYRPREVFDVAYIFNTATEAQAKKNPVEQRRIARAQAIRDKAAQLWREKYPSSELEHQDTETQINWMDAAVDPADDYADRAEWHARPD